MLGLSSTMMFIIQGMILGICMFLYVAATKVLDKEYADVRAAVKKTHDRSLIPVHHAEFRKRFVLSIVGIIMIIEIIQFLLTTMP